MITDDPYPVEKNHLELNVGFTGEISNSRRVFELPLIDFNYGINERMHLKFEVPFVTSQQNNVSVTGLGKSSVGIKWLIYENAKNDFGFGIFPAFDFNLISSSSDKGLSVKGIQFILPISVMKSFGNIDLVMQTGRVISSSSNGEWRYGFLVGFILSNKLETGIEFAGTFKPDLTDHNTFINIGMRYGLNKKLTLLFSGGKQLIIPAGEEKSIIIFAGTRLFF